MPVDKAPLDVRQRLAELCARNYPQLDELKLRIGVVFAIAATNDDGDSKGPALRRNGYEAAWVAKVTSADERLTGGPDLRVKINGDQWDDWSEARQDSVLDEILYAIEVVEDPETHQPASDDAGRPRLKLKKFDIHVEGYERIIRRHGEASLCRIALDHVFDRLAQKTMGWD